MAENELSQRRVRTGPFEMEPVFITTRRELAANTTKDENLGRIGQQFNSIDGLLKQTVVPRSRWHELEVLDMISDMLTNEAMIETEVTNYTCPLFYLNYMVMRKAISGAVTPAEYLFNIFDDRTLIRADPAVVAQVTVELGMIDTKDGAEGLPYYAPCPMPLEETLRSQNVAGKCIRWKPEDQEFPAQLLEEVWERTHLTTRSQIEIINSGRNQNGKLRMISARTRRGVCEPSRGPR